MKNEIPALAMVACLALLSMRAEGVTLLHDERGRFVGQPPRILDTDSVRVCVPPLSQYRLVVKGLEVPDPRIGELGKNVSLGSPLNGTFAAVPTVDRRSPTYHFFALAIDLRPLGDGLTKLLGKL